MIRKKGQFNQEVTWDYDFGGAYMDQGVPAMACRTNQMPRLVGVDGRFRNSFRVFPGFKEMSTIPAINWNSVTYFKFVEVQKASLNETVRGFVYRDPAGNIQFTYYDLGAGPAAWATFTIDPTPAVNSDSIDVATYGKYLWVTGASGPQTPVTVYWVGTSGGGGFVVKNMGPVYVDEDTSLLGIHSYPNIDTPLWGYPVANGALFISLGYSFMYRYYNSERNIYSGISPLYSGQLISWTGADVLGTPAHASLAIAGDIATESTEFTHLEIFRTRANGGLLYRIARIDLTDTVNSGANTVSEAVIIQINFGYKQPVATEFLTIHLSGASYKLDDTTKYFDFDDAQLQYLTTYNPLTEQVGLPPATNRIANYQGMNIMRLEGDTSDHGQTDLVWSPPFPFRPENFPRSQVYRIPAKDGKLLQFLNSDDYLWGSTPSALHRFHRSGANLASNKIALGWGPAGRQSMEAMDNIIAVATRRGLLLIENATGQSRVIGTVDRTFLEESRWGTELAQKAGASVVPQIQCAFDAGLGCLFILNTVKEELLCLWGSTGLVTFLEDVPWGMVTSGPDPISGGPSRAWFIDSSRSNTHGPFVVDLEHTNGPTMLTLNASDPDKKSDTATGGSTTTLANTGATWGTTALIGYYVYIWSAATGTRYRAQITSHTGTALTFSSIGYTVVSGDKYSIAPISFKGTLWPLQGAGPGDWGSRRKASGMSVTPHVITGDPSTLKNSNGGVFRLQLFKGNSTTEAVSKDATWDASVDDGDDLTVYLGYADAYILPGWECQEAGIDYELLSAQVHGTLSTTEKVR